MVKCSCATLFLVALVPNLVNSLEPKYGATRNQVFSSDEVIKSPSEAFWDDVHGQEFITKLNVSNFQDFIQENPDSFIMFYANWCKSSIEAKDEFAIVAQDMAYTEGYNHVHFGAIDCNATIENKRICNKTYNVTAYPRFLYFRNSQVDRMYTKGCPRFANFFYNWIVYKGSEKFCSGTLMSGGSSSLFSKLGVALCTSILLYVL